MDSRGVDDVALPFPPVIRRGYTTYRQTVVLPGKGSYSESLRYDSRMRFDSIANHLATECLRTLRLDRRRVTRKNYPELHMFPHMHIDVVLEVLGHLHPLDLVHLSRTTREFRTLLCGPALDRLWRESFVEPLPMCPSDIPGRRWAHLLFGRNECEKCRWPKASPNFNLVRRLCTKCTRNLSVGTRYTAGKTQSESRLPAFLRPKFLPTIVPFILLLPQLPKISR
ncbi:hypothetical protein C8R45DRAFT_415185 [Mycena sanguinolenta]|nr:hypothetical protein C8R45DRAFT_415185 [Mycena sanguinolenta]